MKSGKWSKAKNYLHITLDFNNFFIFYSLIRNNHGYGNSLGHNICQWRNQFNWRFRTQCPNWTTARSSPSQPNDPGCLGSWILLQQQPSRSWRPRTLNHHEVLNVVAERREGKFLHFPLSLGHFAAPFGPKNAFWDPKSVLTPFKRLIRQLC